jgi:hypothetical protein
VGVAVSVTVVPVPKSEAQVGRARHLHTTLSRAHDGREGGESGNPHNGLRLSAPYRPTAKFILVRSQHSHRP